MAKLCIIAIKWRVIVGSLRIVQGLGWTWRLMFCLIVSRSKY